MGAGPGKARAGCRVSREALDVHAVAPVVDLHCDAITQWRYLRLDLARRNPTNPVASSPLGLHSDLPRLRQGGVALVVLGIPAPLANAADGPGIAESLLLAAHAAIARDGATAVLRPGESPAETKPRGELRVVFAIEGAHLVGFDLSVLQAWRTLGVRLVGPAHLVPNVACQPSSRPGKADEPLTAYGRALVEAIGNHGLILDLAHMNRRGFSEAMDIHRGPVVVSHTGVAGVRDMWRNITDEQAKAVAGRGGVIGIIFYPVYLRGRLRGTLEDVADHIAEAARVVGVDHVGIGSDFDGGITLPQPLRDASDLPLLTEVLLRRGFTAEDCTKILGGNALRVLGGR